MGWVGEGRRQEGRAPLFIDFYNIHASSLSFPSSLLNENGNYVNTNAFGHTIPFHFDPQPHICDFEIELYTYETEICVCMILGINKTNGVEAAGIYWPNLSFRFDTVARVQIHI